MFWFWKKKDNFNKIELERFIFHKTESMYHFRDSFYTIEPRKKKFGINTVVKNVPVTIVGDKLIAKVRYIGIPDSTVYFILNISNIQKEFVSSSNTVDIIVNASIKGEECKDFKFELSPIFERRTLTCI